MRYYIADTHFFHRSLNEKMDQRGFEYIEHMNEYMIDQWNSKVRKNDEVVVLGDFSWGNASQTTEILDELKGKIYLIRGNHDRFLDDKNLLRQTAQFQCPHILLNLLSHDPILILQDLCGSKIMRN